jgi:hypothetical protein
MVTQDTLPLVVAYEKFKSSEISWDQYIYNLFRFVAGDPHENDTGDQPYGYDDILRKADLLAYSVFSWHRHRSFIQGGCDLLSGLRHSN